MLQCVAFEKYVLVLPLCDLRSMEHSTWLCKLRQGCTTQMRIRAKVFEIILSSASPLSDNCWNCIRAFVKYVHIASQFEITTQNNREVFTDTIQFSLSLFRYKTELLRFIISTRIKLFTCNVRAYGVPYEHARPCVLHP